MDQKRNLFLVQVARAAIVAFLLGFFIAWLFFNYPPKDSGHIAAWVQAFGSLAAVYAALWIYWRGKRKQEADEKKALINLYDLFVYAGLQANRDTLTLLQAAMELPSDEFYETAQFISIKIGNSLTQIDKISWSLAPYSSVLLECTAVINNLKFFKYFIDQFVEDKPKLLNGLQKKNKDIVTSMDAFVKRIELIAAIQTNWMEITKSVQR